MCYLNKDTFVISVRSFCICSISSDFDEKSEFNVLCLTNERPTDEATVSLSTMKKSAMHVRRDKAVGNLHKPKHQSSKWLTGVSGEFPPLGGRDCSSIDRSGKHPSFYGLCTEIIGSPNQSRCLVKRD